MYAIVEIAGQQFKVEQDQQLFVHRLEEKEGSKVQFDNVLLTENNGKVTEAEHFRALLEKDIDAATKAVDHGNKNIGKLFTRLETFADRITTLEAKADVGPNGRKKTAAIIAGSSLGGSGLVIGLVELLKLFYA